MLARLRRPYDLSMELRRLRRGLSFAVTAIVLVGIDASAASARSCPGQFQQGFFTDLTVLNADCAAAKQVLRSWVRRSGFGYRTPAPVVQVGSWRCRFTTIQGESNPYGRVTCRASRGRFLRFYGFS